MWSAVVISIGVLLPAISQYVERRADRGKIEKMLIGLRVGQLALKDVSILPKADFRIGDRPTVLIVYTATCDFCRRSVPAWERLDRTLHESGRTLALVSLDSVPKYVSDSVVWQSSHTTLHFIGTPPFTVSHVPLHIALDKDGLVCAVHAGVPGSDVAQRLLNAATARCGDVR